MDIMKKVGFVMKIVYKYLNVYNVIVFKQVNVYYVKKILFYIKINVSFVIIMKINLNVFIK